MASLPRFLYCIFYLVFASSALKVPVVSAHSFSVKVVSSDGIHLRDMVVYATWLDGSKDRVSKQSTIDIRQKDKGFDPYIGIVEAGTAITFSNLDDITHHIYSVTGQNRFSYTLKKGEITKEMSVQEPGIIAMGCNIHDWMSGYLLVIDTPYFVMTNEQGLAVLNLNESGKYRVVVWHPQMKERQSRVVSLPQQKELQIKLTYPMAEIPEQKGTDDFDFLEGY